MNVIGISIIFATLIGPILAVQAQKTIERARERKNRKAWVFYTLMATRAARVSQEHVQALNMIDLAFYGQRLFGHHRRTKAETLVLDAWHEYLDHLDTKYEDSQFQSWLANGQELFVNVLSALANDIGFRFDRVQLKRGAYSPVAHGELEREQQQLRKHAIDVLSGMSPVKVEVTGFSLDEHMVASQVELQQKLAAALEGRGQLSVRIEATSGTEQQEAAGGGVRESTRC